MRINLTNDVLAIVIDTHGAELQSIENIRTGRRYLWHGDKSFWGRRSPILFPIVGSLWDGNFKMDGTEYALGQHGFARDMEFTLIENVPENEAWFALEANEETMAKYPRIFRLEIGYSLIGERITVMWRVVNTDTREISFQIGAHPAFNYPEFCAADPVHAYIATDGGKILHSQIIADKGCIGDEIMEVQPDAEGLLPVTADTYSRGALIFADDQVHRVSMLSKDKRPYVTLMFSAPLVGLWSPSADAPFMCIEPWWGRADSVGYDGEFSERRYVNLLEAGETFEVSYMMIFDEI